ncbi:MAG: hypothetical protein ACRD1D_06680 [Acidimicrobiales bacterium]
MGPATIRRLGCVAAMVLLAVVWFRPTVPGGPVHAADRPLIGQAPITTGAEPAVVRHSQVGWLLHGTRPDHGKGGVTAAVLALVALLRLVPWGPSDGVRRAPPSIGRRRYAIALRAPPLPSRA